MTERRSALPLFVHVLAGLALALACSVHAFAAPARTEHVEAELVSERAAAVPGQKTTIALRLKLDRGWHTYWQNPGDTGLPTTLAWTLPAGVTAGAIQWPAPHALAVGPLMNYGYEGEVLHLVDLDVPASFAGTELAIKARADWLVCKETCIPEGADLVLTLPIAPSATAHPQWGAALDAARAALPRSLAGWEVTADGRGTSVELALRANGDAGAPGAVRFFPFEQDRIEPAGRQTLVQTPGGLQLTLPVASTLATGFTRVAGVLTADGGLATPQGIVKAATIDVPLRGTVLAGPKPDVPVATINVAPAAATVTTPLVAIALAVVGGLLLNLMPCVFPVLSLKVLGFARHHDSRTTMRAEAGAFAGGVLLTFLTLGFVLFGLRAAGEQLGWGFQLQSPAVVTSLALLFFVLALNLSGAFEFGQLVPSGLAGWTSKNRTLDAFASGVLAVVIASPCTAPFMGAALGYALAGSALTTLVVFAALGAGMALPYVALAWFPGWRRHLPRPGPWLVRFKQFLAFPLYGTVIWLAWVLGAQRDNDAVLRLFAVMLAVGFALWAWHVVRTGGARAWGVAGVLALGMAVAVAVPLYGGQEASPRAGAVARNTDGWAAYSPARVTELQSAGRTVFVDFTAAWCVTCQVNERLVLNTPDVREAFARRDVALLRADWTRRDAAITAALAALGRNGVPVYVVYRPGQPPRLLPEILNRQVVLDALAG